MGSEHGGLGFYSIPSHCLEQWVAEATQLSAAAGLLSLPSPFFSIVDTALLATSSANPSRRTKRRSSSNIEVLPPSSFPCRASSSPRSMRWPTAPW